MIAPLIVSRVGLDMIARVESYEDEIRKLKPVECPVKQHFAEGLYAREMFIPQGTLLTGKIHKRENLNVMSAGELLVLTHEGTKRVVAPFTIVSPPGTKRIAYALADTVWTTFHPTAERDLAKIEAHFIAQDLDDYLAYQARLLEDREPWASFDWEQLL